MGVTTETDYSIWPCRSRCKADLEICTGCGRSTLERVIWPDITDEERIRRTTIIEKKGLRKNDSDRK